MNSLDVDDGCSVYIIEFVDEKAEATAAAAAAPQPRPTLRHVVHPPGAVCPSLEHFWTLLNRGAATMILDGFRCFRMWISSDPFGPVTTDSYTLGCIWAM